MQRNIEILIGRLVTDEDFRLAFQRDPRGTLELAAEWGLALSDCEVRAVLDMDQGVWDRIADELDGRLQKASLKVSPQSPVHSPQSSTVHTVHGPQPVGSPQSTASSPRRLRFINPESRQPTVD